MGTAAEAPLAPLTLSDLDTTTTTQEADALVGSMPDPQPHVIAAENARADAQDTQNAAAAAETDAAGETFNPEVHAQGRDGRGVKTLQGFWRRRKGTGAAPRRARSGSQLGNPAPAQKGSDVAAPSSDELNARASGVVAANMLVQVSMIVGGEEFTPVKREDIGLDEKAFLENAFGNYFVATGRSDLPPGAVLAVAICGYILPRFTMPKTQTRLARAKAWFAGKWTLWKETRAAKRNARAVQDESGAVAR